MKKLTLFILIISSVAIYTHAQVDITYQKPPKVILDLADAPLAPSVLVDQKNENMVLLHRNKFKSIEELSETEMRLAGLRINPATNIGSRTRYYNNITLMKVGDSSEIVVKGLPANARMANFSWSPDHSKMAFTQTTPEGVELWVLDVATAVCKKLSEANVNANMRGAFTWFADGKSLLVKILPGDKKPLIDKTTAIPAGPRVSESSGEKAQNRTYQDLLKDKADEFNFEQLLRSTIYQINLNGDKKRWKETAMYSSMNFSPDGEYIILKTIHIWLPTDAFLQKPLFMIKAVKK